MSVPRNSAEVAIKLIDKARQYGIPATLQSSLVVDSDSRYVILNRNTPHEATIRLSSHPIAGESDVDLALRVDTQRRRETAVGVGNVWIEQYVKRISENKTPIVDREPDSEVSNFGISGDGHPRGRKPNGWKRRNRTHKDGRGHRGANRLRDASEVSERYGLQRYLRDQLTGDD